ncbi:MAG: hypothetical protein HC890_16905 [Chloroflexaceae bacterium]|nr:hypothetical protein [Chloroflexaceae bacterium]
MTKSTLYTTAKVLPGNKLEIEDPNLLVGQTVEVIILVSGVSSFSSTTEDQTLSLDQRLAFLRLPIVERRRILTNQAEAIIDHYQQDSEWQELMTGDIINYQS